MGNYVATCNTEPIESLYYYNDKNILTDELGFVIHDIYNFINPTMWYLFLQKQEDLFIKNNGVIYHVTYLDVLN
jgi:hypothetical protein